MNSWATCKGALFSASSLCFRHDNGWDTMELKWFRRTRTSCARYFHCEKGVQNRVRLLLLDKRGADREQIYFWPQTKRKQNNTQNHRQNIQNNSFKMQMSGNKGRWSLRSGRQMRWALSPRSLAWESQAMAWGRWISGAAFPDWGESKKRKRGQGGSSMWGTVHRKQRAVQGENGRFAWDPPRDFRQVLIRTCVWGNWLRPGEEPPENLRGNNPLSSQELDIRHNQSKDATPNPHSPGHHIIHREYTKSFWHRSEGNNLWPGVCKHFLQRARRQIFWALWFVWSLLQLPQPCFRHRKASVSNT